MRLEYIVNIENDIVNIKLSQSTTPPPQKKKYGLDCSALFQGIFLDHNGRHEKSNPPLL